MNGLYIGIGVTLILALLAALIGPFFVDWGTYRAVFEREATKIVGLPVTVIGEVDARLLPSPRIRFGDVVIGAMETPLARIGRFELDIEAAPLLKGDVRISEMRFERPVVEIAIDAEGRPRLPARAADARDPGSVAIDQLEIAEGRLVVTDARSGGRFELARIAAVGSAASLAGPWRLDGAGLGGGRDLSFHLGGGRTAEGGAVKLHLSPGDDPATLTADLVWKDGAGLIGKVVAERRGAEGGDGLAGALATWRAEAQIAGDARAIEASGVTLALGPEERAAQFTGQGRVTFGAEPGFELTLAARQIELDRLIAGEVGRTAVPMAVAETGLGLLAGAGTAAIPGRIRVEAQGLVVGGGAVQEVVVEARTRAGGLHLDRLEARLPGRARLAASGRLAFEADVARFDGTVDLAAEQPAMLAGWWRAEAVGDRLDPVALTAKLALAPGRIAADDLRLEVAQARARGHFDWSVDDGARVGLAADRLELDQVTRLGRLFLGREASRRPTALALDLDAGQMVVGGVVAKGVSVGVKVAADDVAIERLAVQDLAGARLAGSGRIADPLGAPRGTLDLTLGAARPEASARALATLAGLDAAAVERVAATAALAAPLDLVLRLEGRSEAAATALTGRLRGFAGGVEVAADLGFDGRIDDPTRAVSRLSAKLAGEKAAAGLVRLLGGGGAAGPVAATVEIAGRPVDGLKVAASGRAGAASATIEGTARVTTEGAIGLDGLVKLATPDATALGALGGRPILAFERSLPVDLSTLVGGVWPKLEFGEFSGRVGETALRGSGRLDLGARPALVEGRLDADRLDVETAAETLFGGPMLADDGAAPAIWATAPLFGSPLAGAVTGALSLSVDRAAFGEVGLDRLRTRMVLGRDETRLEGIDAGFAGGRVGGEIRLGRGGDGVSTLAGRLTLDGANLGELAWRRGGRPVASGRVGGEIGFTATGRSAAALVTGLGGEGRLRVSGARVTGLGGEALATTRVALGEAQPTPELVDRLFRARLDASESELPGSDIAFALQAGVARSGRMVIETPSSRLIGRVSVDFGKLTLDADGSLEPAGKALEASRTAISRATPSVGIAFRGPLAAPERSLDVAPLVAHLTLAGFEREIERVETLQQDIAERARFARERRRLEEIRAAEEAAKREAEARREAEEAAKRAPPPLPPPIVIGPPPAILGGASNATAPVGAVHPTPPGGASVPPSAAPAPTHNP